MNAPTLSLSWSFFDTAAIIRRSKIKVDTVHDLTSTKFGRQADDARSQCFYCHIDRKCRGHWGHIVLATHIIHPITGESTCVLPVCPLALRPTPQTMADITSAHHVTTKSYSRIVRANINAKASHTTESYATLNQSIIELFGKKHKQGRPPPFIMRFKGKAGRLRNNILGKRVNSSARSVIVGDPSLSYTEVGIPKSIANVLTIEERVNDINRATLIQKINHAIHTDTIDHWGGLDFHADPHLLDVSIGTKLTRPLENGDIVILNRQPTLHKLSMLAFYARIVPWSTIRIPPVVTKGFNADFDGDEMNIFAISSQVARAEAECLMHVKNNKRATCLIHDTKLEAHIQGRHVCSTDDGARIDLLNSIRLRGFSIGADDLRSPIRQVTCTETMNVHNVKNKAMQIIKDAEPPESPWRHMITAKSKGNWANLCAIKATLGQQFIHGHIPSTIHPWEHITRANTGFISSSYTKGLNAKEFFFHCVAGREGLIDTAIRTADAGYTHRKIARFLEDIRMCHDQTIRDEAMNVVAFPHAPSTSVDKPGGFVGIDTAQHIGEPATQLTLNTFHSSGAINEITTSGLSRLKELLHWTKKPAVRLTKLARPFHTLRASWVLRHTTLATFTASRANHSITIDHDALLQYDTDIQYIANTIGARITSNTTIYTNKPPDTHILGVPNIIAVNNGIALHTGHIPRTLMGTSGYSRTPTRVNHILGIEAARAVFIDEISIVLPQVNTKYIELLADSVTYTGVPTPLNHSSFKASNVLKSASFERAQTIFPKAANARTTQPIIGISEKIIFGQLNTLPITTAY